MVTQHQPSRATRISHEFNENQYKSNLSQLVDVDLESGTTQNIYDLVSNPTPFKRHHHLIHPKQTHTSSTYFRLITPAMLAQTTPDSDDNTHVHPCMACNHDACPSPYIQPHRLQAKSNPP
jgi:hypothetical protein